MLRATDLAHLLVRETVQPGDWVIDATVGNGHDTAFLASLVGCSGRVFGFDVQTAALEATRARLPAATVVLLHAGHEMMHAHLPDEARGRIAAVMFNLGYLPGAAKHVTTRPETTLAALQQALVMLAPRGRVALVLYRGHPGGEDETDAVKAYACALDPAVFSTVVASKLNAKTSAPEVVVIERRIQPAGNLMPTMLPMRR